MTLIDIALMHQAVQLDPMLASISEFIDEHDQIVERVRKDLVRGLKNPDTGRSGLTAPQVLRSMLLMCIKNWDLRELRERIADNYSLRQFTCFYSDDVLLHYAFNRSFNRLTPETVKIVNDAVVQAAVALGLEDGAKLRVDTTVVETDVHHPTDNALLWDVVRVVTRLVRRLAKVLGKRCIKGFHNRLRSAKRRMYEIQRMTSRQRAEQLTDPRRTIGLDGAPAIDRSNELRCHDHSGRYGVTLDRYGSLSAPLPVTLLALAQQVANLRADRPIFLPRNLLDQLTRRPMNQNCPLR